MSQTNSQVRTAARAALKGRWGQPVLTCFILLVITIAFLIPYEVHYVNVNAFDSLSVILLIVGYLACFAFSIPLNIGVYGAMKRFRTPAPDGSAGYDPDGKAVLANSFRTGFSNWSRNVLGALLMGVVTTAFMFLLIVPGIIRGIEYMCVPFLLTDEPQLSLKEALAKSRRMMRGHRLDWFLIELGFVGLTIGSLIALYIPMLWLMPFMYVVSAEFYARVKAGYENNDNNKTVE